VPFAVPRRRGRLSQPKVSATDLALDRLDRHMHLCNQPATPMVSRRPQIGNPIGRRAPPAVGQL